MRCRSTFYTSLGRLLMVELGEDEERFMQFMRPLTAAFEAIGATLANADSPLFNADEAKVIVLCILYAFCCDTRAQNYDNSQLFK